MYRHGPGPHLVPDPGGVDGVVPPPLGDQPGPHHLQAGEGQVLLTVGAQGGLVPGQPVSVHCPQYLIADGLWPGSTVVVELLSTQTSFLARLVEHPHLWKMVSM